MTEDTPTQGGPAPLGKNGAGRWQDIIRTPEANWAARRGSSSCTVAATWRAISCLYQESGCGGKDKKDFTFFYR
jgi:hypothetical protein